MPFAGCVPLIDLFGGTMTLFIICLSSDPKGIVALLYFLGYSLALCVSSLFPVAFIPKNDLIDCCDSACWVQ